MITASPIGPSSCDSDLHRVALPNGVSIEVLTGQAGPCGLGAIQVGPDQLRDGRIPMFCEIASPDGRELVDVAMRDIKPQADGGVHIAFTAKVRFQRAMEWMLHASRQQLRLHHLQQEALPAAGIELGLELRSIQRRFGKHLATGFSYRYH